MEKSAEYLNKKEGLVRIDHHNPGDTGYGRDCNDFFRASSLGQVIQNLAQVGKLPKSWDGWNTSVGFGYVDGDVWLHKFRSGAAKWVIKQGIYTFVIPIHLVVAAACEHCLEHAYSGRCPGVTRDDLVKYRELPPS